MSDLGAKPAPKTPDSINGNLSYSMLWPKWCGQFLATIDNGSMSTDICRKQKVFFLSLSTVDKGMKKPLRRLSLASLILYVGKMGRYPPMKMRNTKSLIILSEAVSSSVAGFVKL